MPLVELGDGSQLDVPDDASPEMLQAIKNKLKASGQFTASTKVPEPPGFFESTARDLASGFGHMASTVARGGAMLAGTFGGVDEEGQKAPGTTMAPRTNSLARTLTDAADSAEQYWTGVGNKSTNSDLGKMTMRGAGGSLLVPTPQSFVSGLGGGAGEYVADKLDGGNDNPLMRVAGNVVGSVLAGTGFGLAARQRPQTAALAREGREGFTDQQWLEGQDYRNSLAKQGIDIDLAQAMQAKFGSGGNLTSIRDFLAGHRQGNEVQSLLRKQPEQLATEATTTVGSLPGKTWGIDEAANFVQETATKRLQEVKATRSQLWEDTLANGVAALKASEGIKVDAAKAFQAQAGMQLGEARSRVANLLQELQASQKADGLSSAAANNKLAQARELIASIQSFALPRGTAVTNQGSFSTLPVRGQSILNDSITRDAQAASLERGLPPQVVPAPSLATLSLEKQLAAARDAEAAAAGNFSTAQSATQKTQTALRATERVPEPLLQGMQDKLTALAGNYPNTTQSAELLALRDKLRSGETLLSSPSQINQVFKEFTTRLQSPDLRTAGVDAGTSKYLGSVVDELRNDLGAGFSPIRDANAAYREFTNTVYNPLKQGPVGTLAQPHGYDPAVQASVTRLESLLNKGVDPQAATSSVGTAARELAAVDPSAFENGFRSWLSRKVQSSIRAGGDGNVLPEADPQTLARNVFGNNLQWQGMQDAVAEIARIRGVPPEDLVRGLSNLRQLATAMSNRPGSVGGLSPSDMAQLGGASHTANLIRLAGFMPMNRAGEAVERAVLSKTLKELDTILTSEEGARMLIKFSKVPPTSRAAQTILGSWGAAYGNAGGLSGNNTGE